MVIEDRGEARISWEDGSEAFSEAIRAFQTRWPPDRIAAMTVEEYCVGTDSYCYDLEHRYAHLGGIGGGSAFKFGIYERKDRSPKEPDSAHIWGGRFAWYRWCGETEDEAWRTVHEALVETCRLAREGRYSELDAIELSPTLKWKTAFIYQDQEKPGVLPVYARASLVKACQRLAGTSPTSKVPLSEIHSTLLAVKPGDDPWTVGHRVWEAAQAEDTGDPDEVEEGAGTTTPTTTRIGSRNLILHGPPGTGKTYSVFRRAVTVCDGHAPNGEAAIRERFHALRREGRIEFVTFHQSFGYEDFVEGLRPVLNADGDGQLRYEIHEGVFRTLCRSCLASKDGRGSSSAGIQLDGVTLWKMSLGAKDEEDPWVYEDCIQENRVRLGYGGPRDYSGADTRDRVEALVRESHDKDASSYVTTAVNALRNEMSVGDLVVVTEGNLLFRAIGRVVGEYEFLNPGRGWQHSRPVEWLRVFEPSQPWSLISDKKFSQATIYRLRGIRDDSLAALLSAENQDRPQPHVLIIDEINRGNIARIFGELITLLEEDKRLGAPNEIQVRLPQSGDLFGVPANLHIIGTMNTADRSIAFLDAALRRRFRFEELMPRSDVVRDEVGQRGGTELADLAAELLDSINARVEILLDREHQIGHAYLVHVDSYESLRAVLINRILPLLQEYFHGDWTKVCQVFGIHDPRSGMERNAESIFKLESRQSVAGSGGTRLHVEIDSRFLAAEGEDLRVWFERVVARQP